MKRMTLLLLSMLLAGAAVAGQIYKWKDAEGKIHYSDTPPPVDSKVTTLKMRAEDQPVSAVASPKAPPIVGKSASAAAASAPAAPAPSEKDPKLCQQAQARKTFLQSGQLTRSVNEKGEVEFMSDQKRAAELADTQKAIERFCP
ncbi:MAG: hypothetical protein H6R07_627 [Proteobacteria bacterium]|nr:hypothetical protein [Pseudomonadota bacterium]